MKLRGRVALASLGIVLVLVGAGASVNRALLEQNEEDGLAERITDLMTYGGGLERCLASPETFEWHLPRADASEAPRESSMRPEFVRGFPRQLGWSTVDAYAYGTAGKSLHPSAPPLDALLYQSIVQGQPRATKRMLSTADGSLWLLVHTDQRSSDCAFVVARATRSPMAGSIRGIPAPPLRIWLIPALVVMVVVLVTLGPVVRRIRRLTEQVRASADAGYRSEVVVAGRDELTDLAQAFQDARQTIRSQMDAQEKRERTLRDFLDNTTHDVMIPLTVLSGHIEEIQRRIDAGEAIRKEVVLGAMQEAHYMASLIHNLSTAAKLEAGQPNVARERVDLNALVERVVARHDPIARRVDVALEHAVPADSVYIIGDVTLVEQSVSNLVHNAVRYNQSGGHVAVVLEQNGAQFLLRVMDDGPGIAEDEMARLLERHHRGTKARSRAPDGRGLGLDITRRVAELHAFDLRFSRSVEGGLNVQLRGKCAENA